MKSIPLNQGKYYTVELNRGTHLKALMETTGVEYLDATSVEEETTKTNVHFSISNKTLFINFVKSADYELHIFDILGNEITSLQSTNSNEISLNMNSFLNGVYYFVITSKGKTLYHNKFLLY